MIFFIDPEIRRLVAHVRHDDGVEVFDCTVDACGNPVCRCRTTTVVMRPRSPLGTVCEVRIDLNAHGIDAIFRKRASRGSLAFAERLCAAMDRADFELISNLHSALKNRICEEAKPSEVNARFD